MLNSPTPYTFLFCWIDLKITLGLPKKQFPLGKVSFQLYMQCCIKKLNQHKAYVLAPGP